MGVTQVSNERFLVLIINNNLWQLINKNIEMGSWDVIRLHAVINK